MTGKGYKYWSCVSVWMLLVFIQAFVSCNRIEDELDLSDEVRLTATLSPVMSSVYTKGEIKSDHAGSLGIGLAKVVGQTADFKNAESSALEATMGAPDQSLAGLRDVEFEQFQGFPNSTDKLNYVAWYPYHYEVRDEQDEMVNAPTFNNPETGNSTVTFPIPDDASIYILYSDVTSGTRLSGFKPMTFRHALVKYTIKVYAMESDDNPGSVADVWGDIESVVLEGLPSECTLTLPASSAALPEVSFGGATANVTRQAEAIQEIPVGFSNASELTYFLAPPPSGENKILNIKVITEKSPEGKNVKTSIAREFQKGNSYQIYLRFTTHGIVNAEVVAGEWQENDDILKVDTNTGIFYDLSEGHTANSYVISSAYSYCFDATVRGNGYTGVAGIPGAPADIYKVGDAVTAEIVWTDLITDVSEDIEDYFSLVPNVVEGRVFFTVPPSSTPEGNTLKREGNVVVGVRDSEGNMLWTWHIWLTDRPAEQSYKNGFNVQDRDLGATAYNADTEPTGINGLYYQWGRPTPLPLGRYVYKPNDDPEDSNPSVVVNIGTEDDVVPIIERVKSPTKYFTQRAIASDGAITKSLWGWRSETDEYAKTIYDPCPPGYRMPSFKLWRDLVIWDDDGNHDAELVKNGGKNIAAKFNVNVSHVDIYYPMTGYYDYNMGLQNYVAQNVGVGAYMWAATYDLGDDLDDIEDDFPYALSFKLKPDSQTDLNEMVADESVPSYLALPVRCVSRMSKAHVTNLSDYQTANSYIVSKNGFYKFKATVRGNGIGQLVSPGATTTIVLTEQLQSVDIKNQLVKVKPLWWKPAEGTNVTAPDFLLLNDGNPDSEGYVSFNLETFNEGNLVLAGYDAKGEIIWSWHLWFTDEPEMMNSNAFVVMDRNLGATYAPQKNSTVAPTDNNNLKETYGFYYQWGRKDPFITEGQDVYEYKDGAYVQTKSFQTTTGENPVTSSFATESVAANKTVANSVKNPMTFHLASDWTAPYYELIYSYNNYYNGKSELYTYSLSSYNTSDYQCFSNMLYPDNRKSLWGYSAISNTYGVTTSKTMYDPCPPGYVVAYYLVWTNTERNDNSDYAYYTALDGGFKNHGLSAGDTGLFLNRGITNNDPRYGKFDLAWYPYSGYMRGSDAKLIHDGSIGFFHTSTPAGLSSRNIAYNKYQSGQGIYGSSYGLPSTFAYPVRCQKE